MTEDTKKPRLRIKIGTTLGDELRAFGDAWKAAERGEDVEPQRVLAFENLETFQATLSAQRVRLFRHLRKHPAASVSALARSLDRPYRRVHDDVVALAAAGLVEREGHAVRAAVSGPVVVETVL